MKKLFSILLIICSYTSYAQYCHTDFESQPVGTAYVRALWQADGFRTATWDQGLADRTMIDNSTSVSGTKSLRVTYPANTYGPTANGCQIPLLVNSVDELYMSYWIRFSENFTWGTTSYGGKIPGIAGGDNCSGGEYCEGTNGFSCRFMWRAGGRACLYLYDMTKESFYGEDHDLLYENGKNVKFVPGTWYHLAERVKINSNAESSDGEIDAWINGEHVLHLTNRKFVTNDDKCDKLYISTFHGGDDDTWCPLETCYIWFDDIKISTNKSDVEYKNCSKPDLGSDKTLCGVSSVTLDAHIQNEGTVCSWVKDGEIVATGKTYNATTAGTYIVLADSLGCSRKDTVIVYSDLHPDLGEDLHICEHSFETLDAHIVGNDVSYSWYKNGTLLSDEKSQTLTTKDAGTYKVIVSSPSCASGSDEIQLTSGLLDIPDVVAEENSSVTLAISNPDETTYDWYDNAEDGTKVNSGNTFVVNANESKTYYVEDRNGISTLVGKPKMTDAYSYTEYRYERRMKFEVYRPMTIDSITIYLVSQQDIVINILDQNQTNTIYTKTFPNLSAGEQRIALNAGLEAGLYYMSAEGSTDRIRYSNENDTDIHFPYTIDGLVSILGSNTAWIDNKPYYLFFYNWRVSTGNHCARTPVKVTVNKEIDQPKGKIYGTFIQPWLYNSWTDAQWAEEASYLKSLGIEAIIMGDVAYSEGNGWNSYYPTSIQGMTQTYDYVDKILSKAKEFGFKVYLGMGNDGRWWNWDLCNDDNYSQFSAAMDMNCKIAKELYQTYKSQYGSTFAGFYSVYEIWNHVQWNNAANREIYASRMAEQFNKMIAAVNQIDASMPIYFSPFATNADWCATLENTQAFYESFISQTNFRSIDAMLPMDNVGGGGQTVETVEEWTAMYGNAIAHSGNKLHYWANVENFVQPDDSRLYDTQSTPLYGINYWGPAPIGRYAQQIAIAEKYVDRIYTFAFAHYHSPINNISSIYDALSDYLQNETADTEFPQLPTTVYFEKQNVTNTATSQTEQIVKLWWSDDISDNQGIIRVNLYKDGQQVTYRTCTRNESGYAAHEPDFMYYPTFVADNAAYTLGVVDVWGNETRSDAFTIDLQKGFATLRSSTTTQTISLRKGWNLMSFNVHPADSSVATLFSQLDVSIVKDNDGFWKKSLNSDLQTFETLSAGKGYLVFMNAAGSLNITGKPMTNTAITKQDGWNLIGCPFETDTPIETIFDANNCVELKNFDGIWRPNNQGNTLENLTPGEGYFVR